MHAFSAVEHASHYANSLKRTSHTFGGTFLNADLLSNQLEQCRLRKSRSESASVANTGNQIVETLVSDLELQLA